MLSIAFAGFTIRYPKGATAFVRPDGRELVFTPPLRDEVSASFLLQADGSLRFLPNFGASSLEVDGKVYTLLIGDDYLSGVDVTAGETPPATFATTTYRGYTIHYDTHSQLFHDDDGLLLVNQREHEINLHLHATANRLHFDIGYAVRLVQNGPRAFTVHRNDVEPLTM